MEYQNFNAGLAFADYKQAFFLYVIAALAAFLMSSYFMVSYATGGVSFDKWGVAEWKYAITAIMVTGVMTGFQFRLYSAGETAKAGRLGIIAVIVAVTFSLLSEVGQGMDRDEVRMETKSQNSPTYKAAVAAIGGSASAGYNPYSADLQAAEVKLAQCQARLAQGKEKHCNGSAARVDAVNKMIATHNAASQQQATALLDKAKSMEKDESNYFPLVGVIMKWTGFSGVISSLLFSLTIISMFEFAFHYLGGDYNKAKQKLVENGYDVTRKLRQPPRKNDGSLTTYEPNTNALPGSAFNNAANSAKQTVNDYATKAAENIATENAKAQYARANAYNVAGDALDSAVLKVSGGFKQSPQQRQNAINLANMTSPASGLVSANPDKTVSGATYREELRNGSKVLRDQPLDRPTPAPTSLPKGSEGSEASPTASPSFLKGTEGSEVDQFYALFKAHVQAGGKFSEPACFDLRKNSQFFSQLGKVKMNPIWNECLDRMAAEGVLLANPVYMQGSTKPKYILA